MTSRHVVIVHGIHQGHKEAFVWMEALSNFLACAMPDLYFHFYLYGWTSVFSALNWAWGRKVRKAHVIHFQKWLKDLVEIYKMPEPPSMITHSFGGYVVDQAMREETDQPRAVYEHLIHMGAARFESGSTGERPEAFQGSPELLQLGGSRHSAMPHRASGIHWLRSRATGGQRQDAGLRALRLFEQRFGVGEDRGEVEP